MKSSSSTGKSTSILAVNTKSKKNAKEREKRKSLTGPEKSDQLGSEKGSPNKDSSTRKYAGIGPESVLSYSEQNAIEHLSEEVCYGLAEDLSYKLRYIIHDALIKARLCGRNHILSCDISATFDNLSIDKVYGATSTPTWIALGEQNVYYLDDPIVNLIETAEQVCSYVQPGDVIMTRKWLSETKEVSKSLRKYFENICLAVVSSDESVRQFALKNIRENNFIGPVVEWFYHFGYFLLSKDITYDCLTLCALSLIEALEKNHVAPMIVSEKQLKLLVRLILQRLLRSLTTTEVLKPMCKVLALLCDRIPVKELVIIKINQKIPEVKENFALSIISVINAIGICAIQEIFIPNMNYFLSRAEGKFDAEYTSAVLLTYSTLCRQNGNNKVIDEAFYNIFGTAICYIWKSNTHLNKSCQKMDINWLNVKLQLMKTRRKVPCSYETKEKYTIRDAFPEYYDSESSRINQGLSSSPIESLLKIDTYQSSIGESEDIFQDYYREDKDIRLEQLESKCGVSFQLNHNKICPRSSLTTELDDFNPNHINVVKPKSVIVGKRTLLISVLKNYKIKSDFYNKCNNHSLMFHNI